MSFYNTSRFTLGTLAASDNPQRLRDDFESYLNGYSANVRDHVLANFRFHNQIETMSEARILGAVIEKFVHPTSTSAQSRYETETATRSRA